MCVLHGCREKSGGDGRDQAVEEGRARAERDEGEHVQPTRAQRGEAAHEERPAAPQHRRRGNGELQPLLGVRRKEGQHVDAKHMRAHVEHDEGEGERHGDPKPAGEVNELGVTAMLMLGRHAHGLERHAADRAMARTLLHDLGMHRARVERASGERLRLALLVEIARGIGGEFAAAAVRTEMIGVTAMLVERLAGLWVDLHPAHGIDRHLHVSAVHAVRLPSRRRCISTAP